jgi:hypothetical protein
MTKFACYIAATIALSLACTAASAQDEKISLICNGMLHTVDPKIPYANLENQTLEIDLSSGQMSGLLGGHIKVYSTDTNMIHFGGPLFGLDGIGNISRVNGKLFFVAPWPLPESGSKFYFDMQCRPVRQMF